MSTIKPCPFCGNKAMVVQGIGRDWYRIKCLHTGDCILFDVDMPLYPLTPEGRADCEGEWNTRAEVRTHEQT